MEVIQQRREAIAHLCEKYGVASLDLFGSAAEPDRFDATRSDVDFVVEFVQLTPSDAFQRFMGFKMALEQLLKRPVDLLISQSIRNPYLKRAIERQRVRIYERNRAQATD
ncbi:MAG: nucleotidyltransferase domain-containing protein [Armatimonadota bacterium]